MRYNSMPAHRALPDVSPEHTQRRGIGACFYASEKHDRFGKAFGYVEHLSTKNGVLLKPVLFDYVREDGIRYTSTADHLWLHRAGDAFLSAGIHEGDTVSFHARAYRYKRLDGSYDFGLRTLSKIQRCEDDILLPQDDFPSQSLAEAYCSLCPEQTTCNRKGCMRKTERVAFVEKMLAIRAK